MLAGWLTGPIIGAIFKPVIDGLLTAQKQKLDAAGSRDAVVADLAKRQVDLDKREAEVNAAVVIAEQGHWYTRSVRPTLGWIVIILLGKILLYDKAFGQWTGGHTDPLDPRLWSVVMAIIISYMGGRSAEKIADKIAGVFRKEK
ncbi:3TM-type holin [Bradyrhizobium valentinum]|uniref:Holin n=1 Tax=Bradyrhizobium valentinum TaxID=1518501 RepID=A0A0R3L2N0_9BRAD|nr:3TM-type holin [Bradyrhizobium valentinum]KRQ99295.1 hypothetical protein CP49_11915 [Bradyrhizobium valentinum]